MLEAFFLLFALAIIFFVFSACGHYRMKEAGEEKDYKEKKKQKRYFIIFLILGLIAIILGLLALNCYLSILKFIVF